MGDPSWTKGTHVPRRRQLVHAPPALAEPVRGPNREDWLLRSLSMALRKGTRLGPYEISAPIGAGGMGEVYRATDKKLKRDVAIKTLAEVVAGDRDRLTRLELEARVLASLNHPHIASIYGLEELEGVPCLVLERSEEHTSELQS